MKITETQPNVLACSHPITWRVADHLWRCERCGATLAANVIRTDDPDSPATLLGHATQPAS